jgi:hypothetical protein
MPQRVANRFQQQSAYRAAPTPSSNPERHLQDEPPRASCEESLSSNGAGFLKKKPAKRMLPSNPVADHRHNRPTPTPPAQGILIVFLLLEYPIFLSLFFIPFSPLLSQCY